MAKADRIDLEVLLSEYEEAVRWHERAERKLRDVKAKLEDFGYKLSEMTKETP